jgi:hypothetical protein
VTLIADVKTRLRLINDAFDQEVTDLIEDAKADLVAAGMKASIITDFEADPDTDPLIKNAIAFYVKAHFGYNNDDREGLIESYEMRKQKLLLDEDYQEVVVVIE